jgi:putative RecB family exonuclease
MENIPQDVLYEAHTAEPGTLLRVVAGHFADRAERTRALRKKSWQSTSRELDGVADHVRAYADQLEQFAANNPDGVTLLGADVREEDERDTRDGLTDQPVVVATVKNGKIDKVSLLPGNTGRCASFRRATPGDGAVCALERGHDGNHVTDALEAWPRTHSGAVCGDVVILSDGTALNCARPLGHDGDEHYDGRYRLWPRGVGTSRQTNICERCNLDTHQCPGCGEPLNHFDDSVCDGCKARETDDGPIPPAPKVNAHTVPPCGDLQPDIATALGTSCMLPKGHTGKHIGYTGARWDQAAPAATLGEQADQMRAAMIPEQRETVENVEREMRAEAAVLASVPAAVMVAEMKEEVSATVAELTGDEPIGTTVNVGGIEFVKHSNNPFGTLGNPFQAAEQANDYDPMTGTLRPVVLGNPFQTSRPGDIPIDWSDPIHGGPTFGPLPALGNPFQAPAPPPAAFLPPSMVPGAAKAHQSHSSITTMEKCGLQYRLKYRDGIGDDTPAWWNVAGTAFHTVVQAIEARYADATAAGTNGMWHPAAPLMDQEREAAAMWKESFSILVDHTERESGKARSTWKAAKGGKEGEAFWREFGGDLARMYVAHRRKFLAEPEGWRLLSKPGGEGWAHEVEFNTEVDGVLLKGFIDAAWTSADGATILIEDFKSGSSEGDPLQPKLYGAALRALGFIGDRRVIGRFYEARKGAHSATMELTTADDAEVSYRANTAQAMDRAGIFPPSPSGYNCSTCAVKSRCPIMAKKG